MSQNVIQDVIKEMDRLDAEIQAHANERGVVVENDVPALLNIVARYTRLNVELQTLALRRAGADPQYASFPPGADTFISEKGVITFNPVKGYMSLPDGTKKAMNQQLGQKARSAILQCDVPCDIRTESGYEMQYRFQSWVVINSVIEILRVEIFDPGELQIVFSTTKDSFIQPYLPYLTRRYGTQTTVNDFKAAFWTPVSAGAATLDTAQRGTALQTGNIGRKTFMIENTGANSGDINLQGRLINQSTVTSTFANDSTTGASLAVASGDIQILDISKMWANMRLRVRATVADSQTDFAYSYLGKVGIGQ